MSMTLGFRNQANTGFLPMGDRLLVTYDAGRPHEIDTETCEIVTQVGGNSEWSGILPDWLEAFVNWPFPLNMSTAHPAWDHESAEMFTVNHGVSILGTEAYTKLVRWDGQGALESWDVVLEDGTPVEIVQSVHQMAATREYIVLMDTAFLVELDVVFSGGEARAQSPDTAMYIISRADLGRSSEVTARQVVIPRECVHFLADFDSSGRELVLYLAHNTAADPSEFLGPDDVRADTGQPVRSDLIGLPAAPTDIGGFGRYVIDPETGALTDSALLFDDLLWGGPALVATRGPEIPDRHTVMYWACAGLSPELRLQRVEGLYADHPYRRVSLDDLPADGMPGTLVRIDCQTAEIGDSYSFPAGRVGLSPVFVPREGSTGEMDGYLICTVMSDDVDTPGSSGDEFWVFDAADLAQGPVARLGHIDLDLPFTLHTAWIPEIGPRTARYRVDMRTELEGDVSTLDGDLQRIFEDEVYSRF